MCGEKEKKITTPNPKKRTSVDFSYNTRKSEKFSKEGGVWGNVNFRKTLSSDHVFIPSEELDKLIIFKGFCGSLN